MAGSTKETMLMIKRKVKAHSTGQMAENTRVDGRTVNNMEMDSTLLPVEKSSKDNGMKVRDSTGSQIIRKVRLKA